ncbi:MAG: hypothetical protein ACJ788_01575 [Ktedonobacteraceae bacterium]
MATFERRDPDGNLNTGNSFFNIWDQWGSQATLTQEEAGQLMRWLQSFLAAPELIAGDVHTLHESVRVRGRFALDAPDGATLSTGYPCKLKVGRYWLQGHIEGDGEIYHFIPDDGNYRDDRIPLRTGQIIRTRE